MYVKNRNETRIDWLEVQVRVREHWITVFDKSGLREEPGIEIDLSGEPIDEIRLIVKREFLGEQERNVADIDEIIFPGFFPVLQEE